MAPSRLHHTRACRSHCMPWAFSSRTTWWVLCLSSHRYGCYMGHTPSLRVSHPLYPLATAGTCLRSFLGGNTRRAWIGNHPRSGLTCRTWRVDPRRALGLSSPTSLRAIPQLFPRITALYSCHCCESLGPSPGYRPWRFWNAEKVQAINVRNMLKTCSSRESSE